MARLRHSIGEALAAAMAQKDIDHVKVAKLLGWKPERILCILRCLPGIKGADGLLLDDVADLFFVLGYGAHITLRDLPLPKLPNRGRPVVARKGKA